MGGFFSIASWNDVDVEDTTTKSEPVAPTAPSAAPKGGRHGRTYKKQRHLRAKTRK
jgi:hypothetical protein